MTDDVSGKNLPVVARAAVIGGGRGEGSASDPPGTELRWQEQFFRQREAVPFKRLPGFSKSKGHLGIGRSSTPRDLPATPRISNPSRLFTASERRAPYPTRFTRGPAESSALVPSVVVTSTRPRTALRWVGLGTAG